MELETVVLFPPVRHSDFSIELVPDRLIETGASLLPQQVRVWRVGVPNQLMNSVVRLPHLRVVSEQHRVSRRLRLAFGRARAGRAGPWLRASDNLSLPCPSRRTPC